MTQSTVKRGFLLTASLLNSLFLMAITLACAHYAGQAFPLWQRLLSCLLLWAVFLPVTDVLDSNRVSRVVAIALVMLVNVLVILEFTSYYVQGMSFNTAFFFHLHPGSLADGFQVLRGLTLSALSMLVATCFLASAKIAAITHCPIKLKPLARKIILIAACLTLLSLDNAVTSFASAATKELTFSTVFSRDGKAAADARQYILEKYGRDLSPGTVGKKDLEATPGKNMVWIYLESLEKAFTDESVFPGLTPNIKRLMSEALVFEDIASTNSVAFTMGSMFATQTGCTISRDHLYSERNDPYLRAGRLVAVGDILRAAGYTSVYMGGAYLSYANKGQFFESFGYDDVYGRDNLTPDLQREYNKWGLYDDQLFPLVKKKFDELASQDKPFNLTLLTLDSHRPGFVSETTPRYGGPYSESAMVQAVHGADDLLGDLVDHIRKSPAAENTIIFVMTDHLMMPRSGLPIRWGSTQGRGLVVFALNAGETKTLTTPGIIYDIPTIVLSLMEVESNYRFPISDFFTSTDPDRLDFTHTLEFALAIKAFL